MNAVILRNGKYHASVQLQDDVVELGPYDTEDLARQEWVRTCQAYNGWGKMEDVDLYEAMTVQKEILIKQPNKYKKSCGCQCQCKTE